MEVITRTNDQRIDELEAAMFEAALDANSEITFADCPLNHYFTPKLYVRQILMPAGALITSEVHKTCHPFRVMQGTLYVQIDNGEWEKIQAPYAGVTKIGTRRVLYIEQDCAWETFHSLDFIVGDENELQYEEMMKVVDKCLEVLIEPHENKVLGGTVFLNQITNTQKELQ